MGKLKGPIPPFQRPFFQNRLENLHNLGYYGHWICSFGVTFSFQNTLWLKLNLRINEEMAGLGRVL